MSDERLRELERRWKETGSVEDEAAWLRERVRAGRFPARTLEFLADLGHPSARLARARPPLVGLPHVSDSFALFQERLAETVVWCLTRASVTGVDALRSRTLANSFADRLPWDTRLSVSTLVEGASITISEGPAS